ncbi:hypothetical protein T8K17_18085 [Thalassobaculum sp. OXR-137]|uniref:hypothetical protein n=1 Tax=Thalassobaculum sp. OXR-137 TaxID=3100173 RepID=UPI002AC8B060|nr:hypothetical protein [Thalassobaculum sp. OXR-137]WPZ33141.1 hypothetical protein T8K17_18085 [Thalassobaculum sp. OXR-137]
MSARKPPAGTLTPWIWPTAEIIARSDHESQGEGVDGWMVDAMTEARLALMDALRHGVPADGREAAILALALLPITTALHKRLMDAKAPSPDLGLVATLRDGLERIALRIAPTDPEERKVFDALHAVAGGEQEGPTVLRFDYATGEAVIGGQRSLAP